MGKCCNRVSSTPGYTYIVNNITQTFAASGGVLQPGTIQLTSSGNNIMVSGNSLVVMNSGTYLIDALLIGVPTTTSQPVIPTINVNGISVGSAPFSIGTTLLNSQFEVREVVTLQKGDVITITNTGASGVNITQSAGTNSYNVNIIIERFN